MMALFNSVPLVFRGFNRMSLIFDLLLLDCKPCEGRGCVFMHFAPLGDKRQCTVSTCGVMAPQRRKADTTPRPPGPPRLPPDPSSRRPLPAFPTAEVAGCSSLPTWSLFRCARPLRLSDPDLTLTSGFPMCLRTDIFAPNDHAQGSSLTGRL